MKEKTRKEVIEWLRKKYPKYQSNCKKEFNKGDVLIEGVQLILKMFLEKEGM